MSKRELEVLRLVAHGYTSKEIANQLGISNASIDTYRLRILEKLGIKSRADLVTFPLQTGLLDSKSKL